MDGQADRGTARQIRQADRQTGRLDRLAEGGRRGAEEGQKRRRGAERQTGAVRPIHMLRILGSSRLESRLLHQGLGI